MPGFWKRQFLLPETPKQRWFDACMGIAAPILCVLLDPVVFRTFGAGETIFLNRLRLFSYAEIALSIAVLAFYLLRQPVSSFLTGALLGSAVFALAVGVIILPLTFVGLVIFIGILGLTPFVTAFVFLRNAGRSWRKSSAAKSHTAGLLPLFLGFILILGVPASLQAAILHFEDRALRALQSGSDQDFSEAVNTLKWLHYDTDEIALTYQKSTDVNQRQRLARAFTTLTGKTVQARLAEIND